MDNSAFPFRFKDSRQLRIYENLLFLGPGPAAFYRDACRLMDNTESFESLTHLVGHCIREIESSLRQVVAPVSEEGSEDASAEVRPSSSNKNHEKQIHAILNALQIPESDQVSTGWLKISNRLHEFAHRQNLRVRPLSKEFNGIWDDFQLVLDVVTQGFRNKFFTVYDNIDTLLGVAEPTVEDAKKLKSTIPDTFVTLNYFFERCSNPLWLDPLKKTGFFDDPPAPQIETESKAILLPAWPQSRFLVRMAPQIPRAVIEIILQMPDCENPLVCRDLVDCAQKTPVDKLPPEFLDELVRRIKKWAGLERQIHGLPESIALFAVHLAECGKIMEATVLSRTLLEILPDLSYPNRTKEKRFYHPLPNPHPRFDLWHYGEMCKTQMPKLVSFCGIEAIRMLADLLDSALVLSQAQDEDPRPEDYSTIWRPAIEVDDPIQHYDIKNILVSSLRDAARQLAGSDPEALREIVEMLEKKNWWVFRRIVLRVLSEFKDKSFAIAAERITNRELFDNVRPRHEYVALISTHYGALDHDQKKTIEDWIRDGPDIDQFKKTEKSITGIEPPESEVTSYSKLWRRERLSWIKPHLTGDLKETYDTLAKELGEPPSPHTPVHGAIASWVGPTSPKTDDELRSMPLLELTEFLRSWQPTPTPMEPTPEGLGRILSSVIKEAPERIAEGALAFKNLDPTYTRALFSGLEEALKLGNGFSWPPVIELAQWVLEQPREIPGRQSRVADRDPDWGEARKSIAGLLGQGFAHSVCGIPFELRSRVWELLQPLTCDPDPSPESERSFGGPNMDPATLSINTTRGEAMHAVVQYALWVHRNLESLYPGKGPRVGSFEEMPEAREVLNEHLDVVKEPSLAVRAVYGQWFPWLVFLDRNWAVNQAPKVFPQDSSSRDLHDAAWGTYLIFCHPYDNVLNVLRTQYSVAVDKLDQKQDQKWIPGDPQRHLAEHLMTFYVREKLALNDPILTGFWQNGSEKISSHALDFLGRVLRDSDEVPNINRFVELWDSRVESTKLTSADNPNKEEMASFGEWFASGKLDENWALDRLLDALTLAKKVHVDHLVAKRLTKLAGPFPLKSVKCLRAMIEGDSEGWSILGWTEEARTILQLALASSDLQANNDARGLINYLGSKGHIDFRNLLHD